MSKWAKRVVSAPTMGTRNIIMPAEKHSTMSPILLSAYSPGTSKHHKATFTECSIELHKATAGVQHPFASLEPIYQIILLSVAGGLPGLIP